MLVLGMTMPTHRLGSATRQRSTGKMRCDHLPPLRPFLTDQHHANFSLLWPASGDCTQQDCGITKDSYSRFAWNRTGETARTNALGNDVVLAQQPTVEA